MLDIKLIREQPEEIMRRIATRNESIDLTKILTLDTERRDALKEVERLKAERNQVSAEVARRKKAGETTDDLVLNMRQVGDRIAALDDRVRQAETELESLLALLPNPPDSSVPVGRDATANVVVREWGTITPPSFAPRPHWEIGASLDILDLEAAARLSGSGFYLLKGAGARLQRALINYMLDLHTADGYREMVVPYLVTPNTMYGTGQLPKFADELYKMSMDELLLIPTAEVPITNLHKGELLPPGRLPLYMVGHTPCFRREAGAAGKDTRGMIRVHQFDKVELVKIVHPERSFDELESLVAQAEKVLQGLKLPYRVVLLSTGDMGFGSAKTYDLELWAPGVGTYLEISSISNFTDFQSRRMNTRFRDEDKTVKFPHTLNGSGVALPRLIAAILETYQTPEGKITIPDPLRPYMGGLTEIG